MNKIPSCDYEVKSNNTLTSLFIGKEVSGKVITLLRSSLYSDKWGSVIREMVSNAYDANKDSGYLGPVEIYLPNSFSEELIIKDYGKGMNPAFMRDYYTNVGFSSKEEDNTKIGAYGIGRLSALQVSDVYSIETVYEGRKYYYTMAVGREEGVTLDYEVEAGNEVGTTIKIPCDVNNNPTLKKSINHWCSYMSPVPLIDGIPLRIEGLFKYLPGREHECYFINNKYSCLTVLNDWVPYVVKPERIPSVWKDVMTNGIWNHENMGCCSLVIRFNTGELNVTVSREDLEYSEQTLEALNTKLSYVYEDLSKLLKEELNKTSTLRELLRVKGNFPSTMTSSLDWKGTKLSEINIYCDDLSGKRVKVKNREIKTCNAGNFVNLIHVESVFILDEPNFLRKKENKLRVRQYLDTNGLNNLYLLPLSALSKPFVVDMDWPAISSLPGLSAEYVKSMGVVKKVEKTKSLVYKWTGKEHTSSGFTLLRKCEPTELLGNELGVYVLFKGRKVVRGSVVKVIEPDVLDELITYLPEGYKDLYLINESSKSIIPPSLRSLDEVILEVIGNERDGCEEVIRGLDWITGKYFYDSFMGKALWTSIRLLVGDIIRENQSVLCPEGLFNQYLQENNRLVKSLEHNIKVIRLLKLVGYESGLGVENKVKELYEGLQKVYPLLWVSYWDAPHSDKNKHWMEYINAIDLMREHNKENK